MPSECQVSDRGEFVKVFFLITADAGNVSRSLCVT